MIDCHNIDHEGTNVMAKDKKAKKADTKGNDKKSKAKDDEDEGAAKATEFKFGVEDIAEELGIKPASVRVQLRNKGIEKAGKSYGWNTKAELKEVISQLKSSDDDDDEDEKPSKKAKKAKDEAPAKKGKKSKDADEKPAKGKKSKKAKDEDEDDD